jgi:phage N-6-adenine-methyltransferase
MSVHFSSATDLWSTPQSFYDELDAEFDFTLDPCATPENAKCALYYTQDDDGLAQDWSGERVFMNPPYGRAIGHWVKKAMESKTLVVCLVPARTDTRWWHDYVIEGGAEVRFLKGRLKFGNSKNSAPFPSAVVIFNPKKGNVIE